MPNMPKKTKTKSTERVRAFRKRQHEQKQLATMKRTIKTSSQRSAEYRARQMALTSSIDESSMVNTANNAANPSTSAYVAATETSAPYTNFNINKSTHKEFNKKFFENPFGFPCKICDRLWFKSDLKVLAAQHQQLLSTEFPGIDLSNAEACQTCIKCFNHDKIPVFSTSNGFVYPEKPIHLPPLDLITERLISPRIPFMQIRRMRHVHGQFDILGQIINIAVSVNTMVCSLPRNVDDDYCINVHIKRKQIHKSSFLMGLVNKRNIKTWLQYLITTRLKNEQQSNNINYEIGNPN